MMFRLAALLAMLAAPLHAEGLMSAEEFDAYTQGKILFFGQNGIAYGAERYLPNRRVEWTFLDGECKTGRWYEEAGLICFVYEDRPAPQCWGFSRGGGGLIARFENRSDTTELYEAQDIGEDFVCTGPKVGV